MTSRNNTTLNAGVNDTTPLKAALYYAQYAKVFPLSPNTKIPLHPGNWTEYATTDPMQIIDWWQQTPNANIALVMNRSIVTLDVDNKDGKDGTRSFRALNIPQSKIFARTPGNGFHFLYRFPPTRTLPFYNATNKGHDGGLDVRSGNAYIVAAPSVINGRHYELYGDLSELSDLPQDAIDLLDDWGEDAITSLSPDIEQPDLLPPDEVEVLVETKLRPLAHTNALTFFFLGSPVHYQDDQSAALMAAAALMYRLNFSDRQTLSVLANNQHTMNVAFRRKGGDFEAQVAWLWKYTCQKARKGAPQEAFTAAQPTPTPQPTSTPTSQPKLVDTLERFRDAFEDRSVLDEYLNGVLDFTDPLDQDAHLQRLKEHITRYKPGITFTAVKTRFQQLQQLRHNQQLAQSSASAATQLVFPHLTEANTPKAHFDNFLALIRFYKIQIRYNEMSHEEDIFIPDHSFHTDTIKNHQRSTLRDFMELHNMPISRVDEFVNAVASRNHYHPVTHALASTCWDGVKRVHSVIECLHTSDEDTTMKEHLLLTWLCSAVMVLRDYGNNPPRGVLVLAGEQYSGKTSFFRAICPPTTFAEGIHIDTSNKDSMIRSTKYWMAEIGELDATFRKSDISALKAHLSNKEDEIRTPFSRKPEKFPRRTVYGATVNDTTFLQDLTGNTRYWPINTTCIDLPRIHEILNGQNLLQFWKEVEQMLDAGHNYLLTQDEVKALELYNNKFRDISMTEELLMNGFDWDAPRCNHMTAKDICAFIGVDTPRSGRSPVNKILSTRFNIEPLMMRINGVPGRFYHMPPRVHRHDIFPSMDFLD